jgi:hypothetical protein
MLRAKQRIFVSSSVTFLKWLKFASTLYSSLTNFTQLYVHPHVCMNALRHMRARTHTHIQTRGYLFHVVGSLIFGFKNWSNGKAVKTEWLTLKLKFKMLQVSEYRHSVPYIWSALYNFLLKIFSFWWTFSMLHLLYPQKGHRSSCKVPIILVNVTKVL